MSETPDWDELAKIQPTPEYLARLHGRLSVLEALLPQLIAVAGLQNPLAQLEASLERAVQEAENPRLQASEEAALDSIRRMRAALRLLGL